MRNRTGVAQLIELTGRTFSNIQVLLLPVCCLHLSFLPGCKLQALLSEPHRTQRPRSRPPVEICHFSWFLKFDKSKSLLTLFLPTSSVLGGELPSAPRGPSSTAQKPQQKNAAQEVKQAAKYVAVF